MRPISCGMLPARVGRVPTGSKRGVVSRHMRPRWTETDRLAALRSYDVLDTPADAAFRDYVQIAAHVCEAPIAVGNFVDEHRQWFAAEQGLGISETPLHVSICAHAILQPGVFVVPDL